MYIVFCIFLTFTYMCYFLIKVDMKIDIGLLGSNSSIPNFSYLYVPINYKPTNVQESKKKKEKIKFLNIC